MPDHRKDEKSVYYAMRRLENDDKFCQVEAELAWPNDDILNVMENIEKILEHEQEISEDKISAKWQYCIIKYLRNQNMNFQDFSNKLDELYAEFNYPEEMDEFVSYMPVKDNYDSTEHTKEENRERILQKVDAFLDKKKNATIDPKTGIEKIIFER